MSTWWIDKWEWWPVYVLDPAGRGARQIELTDEELTDYRRVCAEFARWQERLQGGGKWNPW